MSVETIKGIRMIKKITGNVWRVEKTINGFKFDKTFSRERDARAYLATLETMELSHSGSNGVIKKIKFGKLVIETLDFIKTYRDEMTFEKSLSVSQHFHHLFDLDYASLTNEEILNSFKEARNLKTKKILGKSTLINLKVFIMKVLEKGEEHGFPRGGKKVLLEEISRIVKLGTPPKNKKYYRQVQVAQWFSSEEKDDFWVRTMNLILVTTTLRIGEVQAMAWPNINFEKKTFYVCQMVSSGRFYNRLKKNAAFHEVHLEDAVIERLKRLQEICELEKIVSDWVFPSPSEERLNFSEKSKCPHPGRPISYNVVRRHLQRDQESAGLQSINIHGLRITGATLEYIRHHGTPLAWDRVKKKLNHKRLSTSEGYIQVAMEDIEQAEREQNKESFLDYCLNGSQSSAGKALAVKTLSEEELLDRQIAMEEKRAKLFELRRKNEELEKQKIELQQ